MRKTFLTILFFALMGLVASIVLTKMHLDFEGRGFEQKSFCTLSEVVDCDTTLASSYSKIGGIPTSQFGVIYYLFFFLAGLYAWASEKGRQATLSFLLASSVFALIYSIYYAYISFFRLEVVCLFCTGTYIVNIAHFILLPRALGVRFVKVPSYLLKYTKSVFGKGEIQTRIVIHLVAVLILCGAGFLFFKGASSGSVRRQSHVKISDAEVLKYFYSQEPIPFTLEETASWGNKDAKVTIVDFSDFQCPYCRRAAFSIKPYLGEFKKDVRFVYVNYPLDNACNPNIKRRFHASACLAAKAALCAKKKGKFWEYHDLIFENQKKVSRSLLLKLSKETGLDEEWFNECLVSEDVAAQIAREIEEAGKFKIQGTPAIFINGRPFRAWTDPELLRVVVKSEIEKSKK